MVLKMLEDPAVKAEYDALEPEFESFWTSYGRQGMKQYLPRRMSLNVWAPPDLR
jgi:hypothetical protein